MLPRDAVGKFHQLDVVAMDSGIAARAALFSVSAGLAFAGATILATARHRFATLLTYDQDFAGLPDVIVLDRRSESQPPNR